MFRLNSATAEIRTDLGHGVTLIHRRAGSGAIAVARAMASAIDAGDISPQATAHRRIAFARAVAGQVVTGWEGVGDDDGKPVAMSAAGLDALLEVYPILEAFEIQIIGPALVLDAEKNASAPSPSGTSATARSTARPATASVPSAPRGKTRR